jgi:hypothetical protein
MTSAREGRCHFEKYVKYLDISAIFRTFAVKWFLCAFANDKTLRIRA